MDVDSSDEMENYRSTYREVCQNHRTVTEFRGKLLALLPVVSGAGIYLLVPKTSNANGIDPIYMVAIGILGILVTIGLFLHEIRSIGECGDLIKVGRKLEEKMGLNDGQFIREDNYYHRQPSRLKSFINNLKGPIGAGWVIYPSVGISWLFVAAIGLMNICG